jgi:hypothetical protein
MMGTLMEKSKRLIFARDTGQPRRSAVSDLNGYSRAERNAAAVRKV